MQETLGNWAAPAVWVGIVITLIGVVIHFTPGQVFLRATAGGWLQIGQSFFLFAIAAGMLGRR